MVRTQIQLTEEQFERLKLQAANENVSMAEVIRRAVDAFLESEPGLATEERFRRAAQIAGRFRSGVKDLSENHDKYLAEAWQE